MTPRHKFRIGNPCGPCEYHIERAVKIFAWFDLIFQSLFVVPTILQLKINLHEAEGITKANHTEGEPECFADLIQLAIAYSVVDVINLSMGMLTDVLLYVSCVQERNHKLKLVGAWTYFALSFVRQIFHICGVVLHVSRCSPETYPYEIVTRLLCQYLIYGMWIVGEYIAWLQKGRQFVPKRGQMDPPGESNAVEEKFTFASLTSGKFASSHFEVVETTQDVDQRRLENIRTSIKKSREKRSKVLSSDPKLQNQKEPEKAEAPKPPAPAPATVASSPPPAAMPVPPPPPPPQTASAPPPPASSGDSPAAAAPPSKGPTNKKSGSRRSKSGPAPKTASEKPAGTEDNPEDKPLLEQWTFNQKK